MNSKTGKQRITIFFTNVAIPALAPCGASLSCWGETKYMPSYVKLTIVPQPNSTYIVVECCKSA